MRFLHYRPIQRIVTLAALLAVFLLPACAAPAAAPVTPAAVEAENIPVTAAFPVTIEHKYGSTVIERAPERIVSVGLTEQDALLALGVVPVATREWYGQRPGAIFPWAEEKLGGAPLPEVLEYELDFEKVALLKPDLIVGLYSALTQEEYDKLSQIAPTIAQPEAYIDWGIPWQEQTLTLGRALGKENQARALIADVEAQFSAVREQHPEFSGASAVVASTYGFPESYYAYGSQDSRGRFLSSLGFAIPEEIDQLDGSAFGATISREQINKVDLDALIWFVGSAEEKNTLEEDALYQQLSVSIEGRDMFMDASDPVYDALNFSTVLSLPFAVEGLVPQLAALVDGDPDTAPAPAN